MLWLTVFLLMFLLSLLLLLLDRYELSRRGLLQSLVQLL
jgi:hypothetical protein